MEEKILLVDDDENILHGYKRNLRSKFTIVTATGGKEGLSLIQGSNQFAIVLSDFNMPEMDGIKFLSRVKEISPETVRIMLTGFAQVQTAIDAVNEGNIFRFLTKPCPPEKLMGALYAALEQYRLVTAEKELLDKTLKGSIRVLIDILSLVNPSAFSRAARLKNWAKKIALRLKLEKVWEIEIAALLSQIGVVAVPQEILEKKYSGNDLDKHERRLFESYPETGRTILSNIPRLNQISEAIAYQFVNYDGSNDNEDYKIGDNIPIISRILKVVNDFDYWLNLGKTYEEAFSQLEKHYTFYDPNILSALEAEIIGVKDGYMIKTVRLSEIHPGHILAEDIRDVSDYLLISKGSEITEISQIKLQNYSKMKKIREPIKILDIIN